MPKPIRIRKKEHHNIALDRIKQLFCEASKIASKRPDLAKRYVLLARKIGMKTRTRLPRGSKRLFCKHCLSYFVPSKNVRIRIKEGVVTYACLHCLWVQRYPYRKEKKVL